MFLDPLKSEERGVVMIGWLQQSLDWFLLSSSHRVSQSRKKSKLAWVECELRLEVLDGIQLGLIYQFTQII